MVDGKVAFHWRRVTPISISASGPRCQTWGRLRSSIVTSPPGGAVNLFTVGHDAGDAVCEVAWLVCRVALLGVLSASHENVDFVIQGGEARISLSFGDESAAGTEIGWYIAEHGWKPLGATGRMDSFHCPFPCLGGLAGVLDLVVQVLRSTVFHNVYQASRDHPVTGQMASGQHPRPRPQPRKQHAEGPVSCLGVTTGVDHDPQHGAVVSTPLGRQ